MVAESQPGNRGVETGVALEPKVRFRDLRLDKLQFGLCEQPP